MARLLQAAWMAVFLPMSCAAANGSAEAGAGPLPIVAAPWPEADALFHQDPRWLGADDAYSVDLGNGRVLWLFADTFIATTAADARREATMIHNSVGIEEGYDPSRAAMKFYWRTDGGKAGSFFPEQDGDWYWPGDGIRVGPVLLVFLMKIHRTGDGAFGFAAAGWDAALVTNPDDEPASWQMKQVVCPQNPFGVVVGSAGVLRSGDFIYAFGSREPAVHDIYVVRWTVSAVVRGDLQAPQWWDGTTKSWVGQGELPPKPQPVFTDGATEFTVHYEPRSNAFMEIQTLGFGAAQVAMRSAIALTGPWSPPQVFYRPPEADISGVFNYAAKAHPELKGAGADLVLTYVTNATDFSRLVEDTRLYYPKFLKANITGPNGMR
jgi:hypothetical protein